MTRTMRDDDFSLWAQAAEKELGLRKKESRDTQASKDIEARADQILRDAGFKV
jgi:hypothetical protein